MRYGGLTGAIVCDPDGPGRRTPMSAALSGAGAVVGPTVPLAQLPLTVRVTAAGHRLLAAGVVHDNPMFVADHYDAIMLARDPWLAGRLREQVLAPLAGLPDTTRARLEETLAAWLAAMGDRQATARALQVHPQTVRYRLRQLSDLYGEAWSDPTLRLKLTLAVCWNHAAP
jgi:sugar diacid utilization regulator